MKKRELKDIKNGEKVLAVLMSSGRGSESFQEIQNKTFLDRNATQKALADLQKYGYACKNEKSLWVAVTRVIEEELTDRFVVL